MIVGKHNRPKLVSRTGVQKGEVASPFHYGELAERSNAAVLKTVDLPKVLGFESLTLRHKGL